jgi:hypothetical protein
MNRRRIKRMKGTRRKKGRSTTNGGGEGREKTGEGQKKKRINKKTKRKTKIDFYFHLLFRQKE